MTALESFLRKADAGEPVTMTTAYEATFARLVDESGVDAILVGDSVGTLCLGYERQDRITIDEMIYHARAVTRTVSETAVVVDMPFGTYNASPEDAVRAATRLWKEGGADAVKLEGGRSISDAVTAIVDGGIPVVGHLGDGPQTEVDGSSVGRTAQEAQATIADARALDDAGVSALVLKTVPAETAAAITDSVDAMTVGIGSGPDCDAQLVSIHDLLGLGELLPGTAAGINTDLGEQTLGGLARFRAAVEDETFPGEDTYERMSDDAMLVQDDESR